jgi:hypothetical protein
VLGSLFKQVPHRPANQPPPPTKKQQQQQQQQQLDKQPKTVQVTITTRCMSCS